MEKLKSACNTWQLNLKIAFYNKKKKQEIKKGKTPIRDRPVSLNRSFSHRIDGNSERKQLYQAAFTIAAKAPKRPPDAQAGWAIAECPSV